MRPLFSIALITGLLAGSGQANAQGELAIEGGRIIPISGEPIDKGVVLIREGKIVAVGKDLSVPISAKVIDATGKTIMPGLVEVHSSEGMSQANEQNPNVPFVSVVDSIDPNRSYFEECRRNGVTTVAVVPGNSTMIGGQAAVVKTAGSYVDDMLLKRFAGLKLSLRPASRSSRMSHYAKLRGELDKARESDEPQEGSSSPKPKADKPESGAARSSQRNSAGSEQASSRSPDSELQQRALKQLLKREFPAFIYCDTAMDALQAIKLTKDYKLQAILVLGRNAYKAAPQLAASKLPVVLDPALVFWETNQRTRTDKKVILPKVFRELKVPVTFQVSSATTTLGSSYLWYQAATAVKYGTPVDEALHAITKRPAEILGVSKFVGSIEPTKDADLVILTGDPLKLTTWVDTTIVNGEIVYERSKDAKLKALLKPKE